MSEIEIVTVFVVSAVVIIGMVSTFSARVGVAAPLALTVVGVGIALIPGMPEITVDPHLMLAVILPPLLYAAALHVPLVDFRRNLTVISSLAVVLVGVSAFAAAGVIHIAYPAAGFALALAVGAVVSPPDAVAAISLGKRLGLPPRVVTILEGEGLLNDATALVILSTALTAVTLGASGDIDAWKVVLGFVWAVVGAILAGILTGLGAVYVRSRIGDEVLDIAMSLVVPFIAFVLAEEVHASGVVGVVVAGLVVGNRGRPRIAASRRRTESVTWATFTMLMENGVFLVMGYLLPAAIEDAASTGELPRALMTGAAVTAVLIAVRFAYVPLVVMDMRRAARLRVRRLKSISSRFDAAASAWENSSNPRARRRIDAGRRRLEREHFDVTAERDQRLGWRDSIVLSLAGMRGAVTIAAAQTLPVDHPLYTALVLVAFIVAILTLLPQGLVLPAAVRGLRLSTDDDSGADAEFGRLRDRLDEVAARTAHDALVEAETDEEVMAYFEERIADRHRGEKLLRQPDQRELRRQYARLVRLELDAEQRLLEDERRRGEFSSETLAKAQRLLDDRHIQLERLPDEDAE